MKGAHMKGVVQADYIIAIGAFLIMFALLVNFALDFVSPAAEDSKIAALESRATSLLSSADFELYPRTGDASRVGFRTKAFRFIILVNNTAGFYNNPGVLADNLTAELVTFNYSDFFAAADINSTSIYDSSNESVQYQRSGTEISFTTSINDNEAKHFTVYFDDDSNFSSRSVAVAGTDNLSETVLAAEPFPVLQYEQMAQLSGMDAERLRNSTGMSDFHVKVTDSATSEDFLDYGQDVPGRGTVIARQRHIVYQNDTGGVNQGKLTVQVW